MVYLKLDRFATQLRGCSKLASLGFNKGFVQCLDHLHSQKWPKEVGNEGAAALRLLPRPSFCYISLRITKQIGLMGVDFGASFYP